MADNRAALAREVNADDIKANQMIGIAVALYQLMRQGGDFALFVLVDVYFGAWVFDFFFRPELTGFDFDEHQCAGIGREHQQVDFTGTVAQVFGDGSVAQRLQIFFSHVFTACAQGHRPGQPALKKSPP